MPAQIVCTSKRCRHQDDDCFVLLGGRGSVPSAEYAPKLEYLDILVKKIDISELVDGMCLGTDRCFLLAIK